VHSEQEPVVGPELLLALDRERAGPLHDQVEAGLRELIRSGRLPPGERLPSSRALAARLGVSRGVVLEAYGQLHAEGYLSASQGAPTRVAAAPVAERPPVPAAALGHVQAYELDPFLPDLVLFPRGSWMRSLRAALRRAPFAALGHGDPRGMPELRNALTSYLGRVRGAAPEPEHMLITSGFVQAFAMLCRALRDRGVDRIAIEEPGFAAHRLIAEHAGVHPVPVAVDALGINVEGLHASGCEAVVVTPSHQFPTGAVLAPERRTALLDWAEDVDGLIVEDDYDSELRYDRVPVGALQGLAPERVVHVGSASTRLAPGVRLGWLLSPSWLSGELTFGTALADGGSPALEQLAFADFIERGELDRHLRRARLRYRSRRASLLALLAEALPEARVHGVAAGLFVAIELAAGIDEDALLSRAAAHGVALTGLAGHCIDDPPWAGLVLGFACVSEQALGEALRRVERAVAEVA
jgi:GntR family transcriptional regulator / MocR family aminotransferase